MDRATLIELLRGKGAHADAFAIVEGIPPQLARRSLEGVPHSIYQLVWHMNYWMRHELRRIDGPPPSYPEHASLSWPDDPWPPNAGVWDQTVAEFRSLVDRLTELAQGDDASLRRPIPSTHPTLEQPSLLGVTLWQIMVHNSYHLGQVTLLRQAFALWPPAAGSDSW
jgi:uncharacterized damage-inducible protein DinB